MDAERLKRGGNLTDEFFERQLEKVREIRISERKFYQKITDIYATALDYDSSERPQSASLPRSRTKCTSPYTAKPQRS